MVRENTYGEVVTPGCAKMTDTKIPPFPKMGGHGGDKNRCTEMMDVTFKEMVTERNFKEKDDLFVDYWPKGLVVYVHDGPNGIEVEYSVNKNKKLKAKERIKK